MADTKILWSEKVWNCVTGCTKCSDGCINCYAERMTKRLQAMGADKYKNGFEFTMHLDLIELPFKWKKPAMIFVNSMSDLFHENVSKMFLVDVFEMMKVCHWHTFQVLTKRPQNIPSWIEWQKNVWCGVTVCNQREANIKIPQLLSVKAAVRFVSIEPMLEEVSLRWIAAWLRHEGTQTALKSDSKKYTGVAMASTDHLDGLREIDWVIVGGESGPGARAVKPEWVRKIRDECLEAGVPFMFKQWGDYCYPEQMTDEAYSYVDRAVNLAGNGDYNKPFKIGKKLSGRMIDGKTHEEYPRR